MRNRDSDIHRYRITVHPPLPINIFVGTAIQLAQLLSADGILLTGKDNCTRYVTW